MAATAKIVAGTGTEANNHARTPVNTDRMYSTRNDPNTPTSTSTPPFPTPTPIPMPSASPSSLLASSNSGHGNAAFPFKLRNMLDDSEQKGWSKIISWQLNGYAFKVHNSDAFVKKVLPLYFRQTKYKSFQRQLNLYGFCRFSKGPHKGCYLHEHFIRNQTKEALEYLITRRKMNEGAEEPHVDLLAIDEIGLSPTSSSSAPPSLTAMISSPGASVPFAQSASSSLQSLPSRTGCNVDPAPLEQINFTSPNAISRNTFACEGTAQQPMGVGTDMRQGGALERMLDSMMAPAGDARAINDNDERLSAVPSSGAESMRKAMPHAITATVVPSSAARAKLDFYRGRQHNSSPVKVPDLNTDEASLGTEAHSTMPTQVRRSAQATSGFPFKLHKMLSHLHETNQEHIASWQMNGRAFKVHDQKLFVKEIMPQFSNQTKYESLQRQLNLYGFVRVAKGPRKGCYHHPCFVQHDVTMCHCVIRKKASAPSATLLDDIAIPSGNIMKGSKFRSAFKFLQNTKLANTYRQNMATMAPDGLQMSLHQLAACSGSDLIQRPTTVAIDEKCAGGDLGGNAQSISFDAAMMNAANMPTAENDALLTTATRSDNPQELDRFNPDIFDMFASNDGGLDTGRHTGLAQHPHSGNSNNHNSNSNVHQINDFGFSANHAFNCFLDSNQSPDPCHGNPALISSNSLVLGL